MKRKKTPYVILGLLSEESLSGYEIKKYIDIRFSFFWNESYGQLYPALKSLERKGWIVSHASEDKTKREKTIYAITSLGREELKAWLSEPVEKESIRFEILLKMYFSSLIDEDVMLEHIQTFQKNHAQQLMILNMFEKELQAVKDIDNHGDILRVIDFGQKVFTAYDEWCEETKHYLETRKNK